MVEEAQLNNDEKVRLVEEELRKLYLKMKRDLYSEIGGAIEALLMDDGWGSELRITNTEVGLEFAIQEMFEAPVEDLVKYLNGFGVFTPLASWRLANPQATLAETIEAAFGIPEGAEEGLLDDLFKRIPLDIRLQSLSSSQAEASVLYGLFGLFGMEKEKEEASKIDELLPDQMFGWD